MNAPLFAGLSIPLFVVAALLYAVWHASLSRRLTGARRADLENAARAMGGTGTLTRGSAVVLRGPTRIFQLTASDWSRQVARTIHLGTHLLGADRVHDAGSVFRSPGDRRVLPRMPHVALRPEGSTSRWAKALRLVREIETGDARFDAAVYVEHDDRAATAQLLGDPMLRALLLQVVERGTTVVFHEEGHGVAFRWAGGQEPVTPAALHDAGTALGAIAECVPPVVAAVRPRRLWWLRGLLEVAVLMLMGGIIGGGMAVGAHFGPLDPEYVYVVLGGLPIVLVVGVLLGWAGARGKPHAMRRFLLASTAALGLAAPIATAAPALINATVSSSSVKKTTVTSTERRRTKNGETCVVTVASWRKDFRAVQTTFPCGRVERVAVGAPANAHVERGLLGWTWLDRVEVPGT